MIHSLQYELQNNTANKHFVKLDTKNKYAKNNIFYRIQL
jgi:hypothetical protein